MYTVKQVSFIVAPGTCFHVSYHLFYQMWELTNSCFDYDWQATA